MQPLGLDSLPVQFSGPQVWEVRMCKLTFVAWDGEGFLSTQALPPDSSRLVTDGQAGFFDRFNITFKHSQGIFQIEVP
jgi:hypothetical protein